MIVVYNKSDLCGREYPRLAGDHVYMAAAAGAGVEELLSLIKEKIYAGLQCLPGHFHMLSVLRVRHIHHLHQQIRVPHLLQSGTESFCCCLMTRAAWRPILWSMPRFLHRNTGRTVCFWR